MIYMVIILFLLLSALFSGSEIAYISANKLRIELKKKKDARRGAILASFYEKPADFLGSMLVGNNVALVVFTSLMTGIIHPWLTPFFSSELVLLLLETVICTIIVLIFGEFLPKTFFRLYSEDILFFLAYPLRVIEILLLPFSWLMIRLSDLLLKLLVKEPSETVETAFTRLDLENFVRESKSENGGGEIDEELFGKALNLKDTRVRDCMVPRTEIETIDIGASVVELENLFRETKHSRIIVIKDDIDNVLGYVHHQQLLKEPKTIKRLILDIPFVPEVMRVPDLMNKFIKQRINIACVVDEFAGLSGLITVADILEEILGEIEDEHDEEEYVEEQLSDREFLFSGRLEIDYLNEKYHLNFPEGDYHTLSGFLVMTTEMIPEQGAEIELSGYKFIFELVSETKIETVRVIMMDASPEEAI